MVAVAICLTTFLCLLQSQVPASNGFTLPFTSFSSQVLPRRPTNSSVTAIEKLPSVSTKGPNLKPSLGTCFRPPDNTLSNTRASLTPPLSTTASSTKYCSENLKSDVIRQHESVIQSILTNSVSPTKLNSVPNVPYLSSDIPFNVLPSQIKNTVKNIPEPVTNERIPGPPLNSLETVSNVASQINLAPIFSLPNAISPDLTFLDSNFKPELSLISSSMTSSSPYVAKTESSLLSSIQPFNINSETVENRVKVLPNVISQTKLTPTVPFSNAISPALPFLDCNFKPETSPQPPGTTSSLPYFAKNINPFNINSETVEYSDPKSIQYLPSVLPITNPSYYSLLVDPEINVKDFSANPNLNKFVSLPNTQQNCFEQVPKSFELSSFNLASENSVSCPNSMSLSAKLAQHKNEINNAAVLSQDSNSFDSKLDMIMSQNFINSVLPTKNNNLSPLTQFCPSFPITESDISQQNSKSDIAFKIKPTSIDLKILPTTSCSMKEPLQGCVKPLLKNRNISLPYSSLHSNSTLNKQNLIASSFVSSFGSPESTPFSNLVIAPSCTESLSSNSVHSHPCITISNQESFALDKSASSTMSLSKNPHLQPSHASFSVLPQNHINPSQKVALSSQSQTSTAERSNFQTINFNPVLQPFCSEPTPKVPCYTQSSISFPSLVTSSLVAGSTVSLNNTPPNRPSNLPSVLNINDKIGCYTYPISSNDNIMPLGPVKPKIDQDVSVLLPPSFAQTKDTYYQKNMHLNPTVSVSPIQASKMTPDSQYLSLNKSKKFISQNSFLSNDQSFQSPPKVPFRTKPFLTETNLIQPLTKSDELAIIEYKQPSVGGSLNTHKILPSQNSFLSSDQRFQSPPKVPITTRPFLAQTNSIQTVTNSDELVIKEYKQPSVCGSLNTPKLLPSLNSFLSNDQSFQSPPKIPFTTRPFSTQTNSIQPLTKSDKLVNKEYYGSLNAPKILPSQNVFLSSDQSFKSPPKVPIITRPYFTQSNSVQTLTNATELLIKEQPFIYGDSFPIHPKISCKQAHIPTKYTPTSDSVLPWNTSTCKPSQHSLLDCPGKYANPIIPNPVVIDSTPDKSPFMPLWLTLLAKKILASKSNTFSPGAPTSIPSSNCPLMSTSLQSNSKIQMPPRGHCPLSVDSCSGAVSNASTSCTLAFPACSNDCSKCINLPSSNLLPAKPVLGPIALKNNETSNGKSPTVLNKPLASHHSSMNIKIPDLNSLDSLPINLIPPKSDKASMLNLSNLLTLPPTNPLKSSVSCFFPITTLCPVSLKSCPNLEPPKCQTFSHAWLDIPYSKTFSSGNDKLPLNSLASIFKSSSLNKPSVTLQPPLTKVHLPEYFMPQYSTTNFQSLIPDLNDFNVVSSSPMATSPINLPPIKCPDIFLPLDDISSLIQKPFKNMLPFLNTPEMCPLKNGFDNIRVTPVSCPNTSLTPPPVIPPFFTKSSLNSLPEKLKSFCADTLETSYIPLPFKSKNIESPNFCSYDAKSTSYVPENLIKSTGCCASQLGASLLCCDYFTPNLPSITPASSFKENLYQIVDIPIPYYFQIDDQISSNTSPLENNNHINTICPFSQVIVPVAALPSISSDCLSSSSLLDISTDYDHTFSTPLASSLVSSLPEVILLPSCIPSSSNILAPISTSQNIFKGSSLLPTNVHTATSSSDLTSQTMRPNSISNISPFPRMASFISDSLTMPSSPNKNDFGSLDQNEYVILEEVLLPGSDLILPATSFDCKNNIINAMYPLECFYEITSLPEVSCSSFDPVSVVDCYDFENSVYTLPFSTYPEYLIPSIVLLNDAPSTCKAPVIELLSPSDQPKFTSYDVRSKSQLISSLVKKLANTLVTSALPNLAALCTKDS